MHVSHFMHRNHTLTSLQRATALALLLLLAAILLGVVVRVSGGLTFIDSTFAAAVSHLRKPWLDEAMMALSGFGDGLPRWCVTVLVMVYLVTTRRLRWALALAVAMGASAVLAPVLKLLFHTARPSPLYTGADAFSFPSGHATAAATLYILLGVIVAEGLPRSWRGVPLGLAAVIVALISLSRVYLGAHWLSDVLAGVALGSAIAVLGAAFGQDVGYRTAQSRGWRDGLMILACLGIVAAGTAQIVMAKAHRQYAPFLARERVSVAPASSGAWWPRRAGIDRSHGGRGDLVDAPSRP